MDIDTLIFEILGSFPRYDFPEQEQIEEESKEPAE